MSDIGAMIDRYKAAKEREIASLTAEVERLKKHEAICHCGINSSSHGPFDGHSFVEMQQECPFKARCDDAEGENKLMKDFLRDHHHPWIPDELKRIVFGAKLNRKEG